MAKYTLFFELLNYTVGVYRVFASSRGTSSALCPQLPFLAGWIWGRRKFLPRSAKREEVNPLRFLVWEGGTKKAAFFKSFKAPIAFC